MLLARFVIVVKLFPALRHLPFVHSSLPDHTDEFFRLLESHRDPLWRFVRSMCPTHHDAEDLLGDTVLQAHQAFPKLRDRQAFMSFLFTIASRIRRRQRWRRTLFGTYDDAAAEAIPHADPLPDHQVDVELLRQALQTLPDKQRETVVLFDVLGLSLEEVRTVQGGTLSGVKSRLLRARRTLARRLEADVPEEPAPMIIHHPIL